MKYEDERISNDDSLSLNNTSHRLLQGPTFRKLKEFYANSWKDPENDEYMYRVYFAQQSSNINALVYKLYLEIADEQELYRIKRVHDNTFLTQHAMYGKARELAAYYSRYRHFPKILMVDELLITGRNIAEFLYKLLNMIFTCLERDYAKFHYNYRRVYYALLDAADILVFAQSKDPKILDEQILDRINTNCTMETAEWRAYVQRITEIMTRTHFVENTSFTPSFLMELDMYRSSVQRNAEFPTEWKRGIWRYRRKDTTIWQKSFFNHEGKLIAQAAIRCTVYLDENTVSLTPYLFRMRGSEFDHFHLRHHLIDFFHTYDLFMLADILDDDSVYQLSSQMLVSTLDSIFVFFMFLSDQLAGIGLKVQDDLDRVGQYFDSCANINGELKMLTEMNNRGAKIRAQLFNIIEEDLSYAAPGDYEFSLRMDRHQRDSYILAAEKLLFRWDLQQQKNNLYRRIKQIDFEPWSSFRDDLFGLKQYLEKVKVPGMSLTERIGALLVELQWGNVVLTMSDKESGCFYLKVNENTGITGIMHYYRFLPALALVEEVCEKNGLSAKSRIRRFGAYLDKKENRDLYELLFDSLYDELSRAGLRFGDWLNLSIHRLDRPRPERNVRSCQEWTGRMWPEEELDAIHSFSSGEYITWETEQRYNYFLDAIRFFKD